MITVKTAHLVKHQILLAQLVLLCNQQQLPQHHLHLNNLLHITIQELVSNILNMIHLISLKVIHQTTTQLNHIPNLINTETFDTLTYLREKKTFQLMSQFQPMRKKLNPELCYNLRGFLILFECGSNTTSIEFFNWHHTI